MGTTSITFLVEVRFMTSYKNMLSLNLICAAFTLGIKEACFSLNIHHKPLKGGRINLTSSGKSS